MDPLPDERRLLTAEILSIGAELTVGDTRDTNAGELARSLTALGVRVGRLTALPDDLTVVTETFVAAMARSHIVVSTGGLGPTPDDLTREAIAAAFGETVSVEPDLERWLRRLWARRRLPFLEINLKQAWVIPSAMPLPNPNGTAPGWFVQHPNGHIVVALPGPPREMRPMWHDHVVPRLTALGLGADVAAITYRLAGIGESQVADMLGESLLRASNPVVATYARAEAVDVRISAVGTADLPAAALVEPAAATVREHVGRFIWATGDTTWPGAIGSRLDELGWALALAEFGTGGQVKALLGDVPWVRSATYSADDPNTGTDDDLSARADEARRNAGCDVGLAVKVGAGAEDTVATVAVATPAGTVVEQRTVFLGGANGRIRAALAAASILLASLGTPDEPGKP